MERSYGAERGKIRRDRALQQTWPAREGILRLFYITKEYCFPVHVQFGNSPT